MEKAGILLVNKPSGITSHDLVMKIRRKLKISLKRLMKLMKFFLMIRRDKNMTILFQKVLDLIHLVDLQISLVEDNVNDL